jgi:transcriptional antiterminator RfaH
MVYHLSLGHQKIDLAMVLNYNSGMLEGKVTDWFIVNCKPKQEFAVERKLRDIGINTYLPRYIKKQKVDKSRIDVIAPLFPSYLFAQFDISSHYQMIRYTRGIKTILGSKDYLWTMDNSKVEDIKSRESDGIVLLRSRDEVFHRGDRIVIDEGDFDGWEGIFEEELPDQKRAIIMLTNVCFSSKLIIPKRYLMLNR